jgi:hypothetical protein
MGRAAIYVGDACRVAARTLLNVAVGLSLLLCVRAAADWWDHRSGPPDFTLASPGMVRAMRACEVPAREFRIERRRWSFAGVSLEAYVASLHYDDGRHDRNGVELFAMTLPYWLAVAMTAFAPACGALFWLRTHLRQRAACERVRRGQCPECGYDRRASPGRCPECGTK